MIDKIFKEFDEDGILDVREIEYDNKNYKIFVDLKNEGKLIITDDDCNLIKDKDVLDSLSDIVNVKISGLNK